MDMSEDKIYQGINFSSLKRELTVQKLWRERTWKEILKHFVTALIFGALASFIDIGTDGLTAKSFIGGANYTKWVENLSDPANHGDCIHTGRFTIFNPGPEIEFEEIVCFEQDPIWGLVTLAIIFLPGYIAAAPVTDIIMEMLGKTSSTLRHFLIYCLMLPCGILFPLAFISVKVVCLVNPGSSWKRLNARMTGWEGAWESAFQTILTLSIVFTRADRQPSGVQIASLIASLAMLTKTAIADYLSPKQPLELKDELKATATLLPLFLSNGVFKVLSLAITVTCLRSISFAVLLCQSVILAIGSASCNVLQQKTPCWRRFLDGVWDYDFQLTSLQLKKDGRATKRQNLTTCVYQNLTWGVCHLVVLTCIVGAANSNPDSLNYTITDNLDLFENISSDHFSRRPGLVDNLPLLNGLYVGILSAMAINGVLFYVQMWKPMEEEEKLIVEMEKPLVEEEKLTVEERGSTTATDNPRQGDEGERKIFYKKII